MQLSSKSKAILSHLGRFSWIKTGGGLYCMNFTPVDSRKKAAAFAKKTDAATTILKQAGASEKSDYDFGNAGKFIENDLHRLDIPYLIIINDELNQYLAQLLKGRSP